MGAIARGAGLIGKSFVWLSASLALIAAVDVPLQLFQFKRSLRMTRQELRDESKESEGRPEVKGRIRQMQQQILRRRMMHKIPTADVVLVNPTHFAVALKYDPKKMRAPVRGQGLGRRRARTYGVSPKNTGCRFSNRRNWRVPCSSTRI